MAGWGKRAIWPRHQVQRILHIQTQLFWHLTSSVSFPTILKSSFVFLCHHVLSTDNCLRTSCSFRPAYMEVCPNEYSMAYFQVNMHRIMLCSCELDLFLCITQYRVLNSEAVLNYGKLRRIDEAIKILRTYFFFWLVIP